jgi:hypothetical protein
LQLSPCYLRPRWPTRNRRGIAVQRLRDREPVVRPAQLSIVLGCKLLVQLGDIENREPCRIGSKYGSF